MVNIVMLRAGAFVVVGVAPFEADNAFLARQEFYVGLEEKLVRSVRVRMRFRAVKSCEEFTDWIADRDFGISLLLLEGLTDDEFQSCGGFAGQGLGLDGGNLWVLWEPHVGLPVEMGPEVDLASFLIACGGDFGDLVELALVSLHQVITGASKWRRVNNVIGQYRAARQ
jgi:hypothetical protein